MRGEEEARQVFQETAGAWPHDVQVRCAGTHAGADSFKAGRKGNGMNLPTSNSKTFGERLTEALESRGYMGMEQQDGEALPPVSKCEGKLSRFLQVNVETAREYLQAASCPPSLESEFRSLADAQGVDWAWLLNGGQRPEYIPYNQAFDLLAGKVGKGTTHEEIAAWIWLEGLDAYEDAREIFHPRKFYFGNHSGEINYLPLLSGVYFKRNDIVNFRPVDRYITGKALIERWEKLNVPDIKSFITQKGQETDPTTGKERLVGHHPTCGGTQAAWFGDEKYPPLEDGLFALSEIERIEAEDFGENEAQVEITASTNNSVTSAEIRMKFKVFADADRNAEWWRKMMRNASDNGLRECRHGAGKKGAGGSSLWFPNLIAAWLADRADKALDGSMSNNAAHAALRTFPGYEEVTDFVVY